jgi:predicted phosphodiesterase
VILGLLSDAHGSREGFDLGRRVLLDSGADCLWFLGDAVGYLPGTAVVDALLREDVSALRGNHDQAVLDSGLLDGPTGPSEQVLRHAEVAAALTPDQRDLLARLPIRHEIYTEVGWVLLVHGSPHDPLHGYVYPDTNLGPFVGDGYRVVVMGQTHWPFVRTHGDTTFVNVGSCGLPRDCGEHGSVALLDTDSGQARVLRFDLRAATAAALDRVGPVAPEVVAVLDRRPDTECFGERYA